MTKFNPLRYLSAMFANCMLFRVLYVLCVVLWVASPIVMFNIPTYR
jgi:hypothetical protein